MSAGRPSILMIGDTLNLGGTEVQFAEVACGLKRHGWDVHASCLRAEGPLRAQLEAVGVRAWSCARGGFTWPCFVLSVWRLAHYVRAQGIHLVHCFDFYSNILGVPAARLARTPAVIASQRDLGDREPLRRSRVHAAALRLADYVLVNSAATAERVKRRWPRADGRIAVIPNGVDLARFSPAPGPTRPWFGRVTVGALANLRPEKGLEDLIRAAVLVRARCPHARFVVWGEGSLRPELEGLIQTLGLGGVAELRGTTTEPETALRTFDIFVLPSTSESCSNALLEAMATRLPVVATRVGGNLALVDDEKTGLLVPSGDPSALAKAVIRLIENPALAAELAVAGRDRVRAEFGIERLVARVEALYDRALAGGQG